MFDRRYLDINFSVLGVSDAPAGTPGKGDQYIVGSNPDGPFAGIAPNSLAVYTGSKWSFYAPRTDTLEVLNISTKEVLKYNGAAWVPVVSLSASGSTVTETHIITATEIAACSFALTYPVAQGTDTELHVCGVQQVEGIDFTASANTISWAELGLADIELLPGDTFTVRYVKGA